MARIAVGGFVHETNTFVPQPTDLDAFTTPGAWPGMVSGAELEPAVRGRNLPVAGFLAETEAQGHEVLPLTWAAAPPGGLVTADAFATILNHILEGLSEQVGIDGVYLDLHGAMVTERHGDGEGLILQQVRALIGNDLPLVASLDLHANVSAAMVEHADGLIAYRTYPHVDMADTGARTARFLDRLWRGERRETAFTQIPFLIPVLSGHTGAEPAKSVYERLAALETADDDLTALSFTCGFPLADVPDAGPAVVAHAHTAEAAERAAGQLAADVGERESAFAQSVLSVRDGVAAAIDRADSGQGPVVLADTQDNPGAGGSGDTTGVLRELVDQNAADAIVAVLIDPDAAATAHNHGSGGRFTVALGGRSGVAGDTPFEAEVIVEGLGDGRVTGIGPFYAGARMALGPMAVVRIAGSGVRVILGSSRIQAADRGLFQHLGLDPAAFGIVALKSSVHFRADFEPLAAHVLVIAAPGLNPADPARLTYRHLRSGVRLGPDGPTYLGAPTARDRDARRGQA
ncbi:Microcystin degradation protein MlrC, contains DUF1485 domain [Limimonas halophila]|uniref:Microcystinase C n=1 Tax=Limimonas halophila TaxID=1082479 RepID=A0A1G7NFY4_9PROT|nr:M81 family metallopeptidase [Limimonas halophila]SDF72827.1 Microcystin degradation protein MlrC, contains DUF1485 domain [Limimonas halophila]